MTNHKSTILKITIFFLVSQIVLIIGLASQGHFDYIRSILVTASLWLLYTFLEARYGLFMNHYVRVVVVISLLCDGFGGYYLNLYATSVIFDKILHVFGSYSFALFAYILVAQLLKYPVTRSFKFFLVVSLGLSIGAFYEILEFLTDTISHPPLPSQPSLLDTDLDLIGDMIGATIAAIHATFKTFINLNF